MILLDSMPTTYTNTWAEFSGTFLDLPCTLKISLSTQHTVGDNDQYIHIQCHADMKETVAIYDPTTQRHRLGEQIRPRAIVNPTCTIRSSIVDAAYWPTHDTGTLDVSRVQPFLDYLYACVYDPGIHHIRSRLAECITIWLFHHHKDTTAPPYQPQFYLTRGPGNSRYTLRMESIRNIITIGTVHKRMAQLGHVGDHPVMNHPHSIVFDQIAHGQEVLRHMVKHIMDNKKGSYTHHEYISALRELDTLLEGNVLLPPSP